MKTYSLYINGNWVSPSADEYTDDLNPATGQIYAKIPKAQAADVIAAIDAAEDAKVSWAQTSPVIREGILLKAAEVMLSRMDEIADLMIDETGATISKAYFEVTFTADILRAAAGECRRILGDVIQPIQENQWSMVVRAPLGVVAAIAPFNFPLILAMKKIAFALAAGNTMVLKPASDTAATGFIMAEVFEAAGLPPGVFNVVTGSGGTIGDILVSEPRIKMVSFTGSTAVGTRIGALAATHLKKYTLELGGKNPLIILDDVDVDYAVSVANFGAFFHQGQICMATSKILVVDSIFDEFIDKFVEKAQTLKVGNPREKDVTIGPLIRPKQSETIDSQIKEAVEKGATLRLGGNYEGTFFEPTILTDVTPEMGIFHEESFGPVVSVIRVKDENEAIELANNTIYGLSSAVLTNDITKAFEVAQRLQAGMVHINDTTVMDDPMTAFGGVKSSGMGREGGHYSIEEFTECKWITIQTKPRIFPF